jgi:hypothetical protein
MARSTAAQATGKTDADNGRSWGVIALRTLAATIGAYAAIYWLGGALAVLLPMPHSEIVYLVGLVQVIAFVPLVLWIFTTAAVGRMLVSIVLAPAAGFLIVWLHGAGPG